MLLCVLGTGSSAHATGHKRLQSASAKPPASAQTAPNTRSAASAAWALQPEIRLIEVYQKINQGHAKEALQLASALVHDRPNFQLAQLIYGDLLRLQTRPITTLGDVPATLIKNGSGAALAQLRHESMLRIRALLQPPPPSTIPSQIIGLSPRNKHVIAVDTSKARLYLLENSRQQIRVIAHYYISVGLEGTDKRVEGDNKTPLGIYYLTAPRDPKDLPLMYGGGALPINYPNPYDLRRGKTGSGIWLHGSPPEQYARLPKATNGCVVMANPDLLALMAKVEMRTTPVIITPQINWITPEQASHERHHFEQALNAWRSAKNAGDTDGLRAFYTSDFNHYGKSLSTWWPLNVQDIQKAARRPFAWQETSALLWRSEQGNQSGPPVMVVTYDEQHPVTQSVQTKRQYWLWQDNHWRIFFEGVMGGVSGGGNSAHAASKPL